MHWAGGDVSQHVLGREGVYPSMHWAGGVCVPACTAQWCLSRVVSAQGVSAQGDVCPGRGVCPGVCLPKGMCLPRGGVCQEVSAQGSVCLGVCLPRGCLPRGPCPWSVCPGGCLPKGVSTKGVSARGCVWQTPPMNRMTDKCKNITLPQLPCGR